jgi:hypothetical protein
MQASDDRCLDDPAFVMALHRSWLRGVLVQGAVCSSSVTVWQFWPPVGADPWPAGGAGGWPYVTLVVELPSVRTVLAGATSRPHIVNLRSVFAPSS